MDDTNEETRQSSCTDGQFHFAQNPENPVGNTDKTESSVSLTEMLAVISESADLTRDLQALMETSPCTSENSHHSTAGSATTSAESKAKPEVNDSDPSALPEVNSPSQSSKPSTVTTNLTCYDKNLQPFNISLQHKESLKFNVEVKNCSNVSIGDDARVNIYRDETKRSLNENASHGLRRTRSAAKHSLALADGGKNTSGPSTRRLPKNSVKKSASKKSVGEKIKRKWEFPMFLSDFTDAQTLHNRIELWLTELIRYLLSESPHLEDSETVKNCLEEAKKFRETSVASCILKLIEAIRQMSSLARKKEDSKKYEILSTEAQFVLAEFYTKEENYLSALRCLKTLEESSSDDTNKSRLYAKMAKIMEHCLENSVDFRSCENEFVGTSTNAIDLEQNVDDIALCYFEKALSFGYLEPLEQKRDMIQISCYLGKAAVLMKCWDDQAETARNLAKAKENLLLTEKLFNGISSDLKCQFYLAESFLLYYEERFKMAVDKVQIAKKIAAEENFLEKECLGCKRLHRLLAKLEEIADDSKPEKEFQDFNSVEDQL